MIGSACLGRSLDPRCLRKCQCISTTRAAVYNYGLHRHLLVVPARGPPHLDPYFSTYLDELRNPN